MKKKLIFTGLTVAFIGLGAYYAFIKKSDTAPYGLIGFAAGCSFFFAVEAYRAD